MSFILDALRKSETERRRDAPPTLAQLPLAMPRSGLPSWVWALIGALCLAVVVLAGASWYSLRGFPFGAETRAAPSAADEPVASSEPAPEPEPDAPIARPVPLPTEAATARPGSHRTLPSVDEARAAGIALPPLELQLVSYSENADQRFVFINGFQYRQGQHVQNGPLIVSIHPDGVVLRQQERDFVLLAR